MLKHFLFVSFLFLGNLAFAQLAPNPMIEENAVIQLGEYTYGISDNNIGGVPNVGIVIGELATLIIDPGMGRQNGEIVLREAQRLSDNTQFYIVSTHYHPEHTTGYIAFPESAIYINSTTQENEFTENGQRMIDLFSGFSPKMGELLADAQRRVANIIFDRTISINLGGVTVNLEVVGPTHTIGDTGIFVLEDRVLFTGDVVMNNSFLAATPGSSISAWLKAFDTFDALEPVVIVPAHGEIGDGSLIGMQREIVAGIRDETLRLKAQGQSADAVADAISTSLSAEHPDWPRANGIASLARSAWEESE
ncbi:MAG: hypothetical protein COA71_02990 [SAR86 cluster bacterium]|uniref:Metallo-beta-lactamase domain-containing protein n=1 Tax=SAR86 cluster bacterium TaxID=2030880 RepID=A0A2A5CG64_9GAMM|nr:MBL fold metallo-hydrolase [Gammaproteobacteria bacterium AH-315-E17]PCJ42495.1 MAG: hypothetical protein COA71_02990 [SAR86 cluster bacterium]